MTDLSGFSMFELFKDEAHSHAQALSDGLLALEARPDDLSQVDHLMRAAHSIKGAARIIDLDPIVELAHAMEDCFVAVGRADEQLTSARVDQLLQGVDVIHDLAQLSESALPDWLESHAESCRAQAEALRLPAAAPPTEETDRAVANIESASDVEPSAPVELAETPSQPVDTQPTPPSPAAVVPAQNDPHESAGDDRTVPVSASNLNTILRLASESMIESRRLQSMGHSLETLRDVGRRMSGILDRLTDGAPDAAEIDWGEMAQLHGRWERILQEHASGLERALWRSERNSTALYHQVLGSRMRPFSEGAVAFPRLIRDLARSLGKQVRLEIRGGSVTVDRDILRSLESPLNHLLRNCVDHGIEEPAVRRAAGKSEQGQVVLTARHHAGTLTVQVADDGRGIDLEQIRRKVVDRQLVTAEMAASLGDAELYDFLFLPGFTTADAVTEVSGRGVGLDVVQALVQEVSGSVRVESELGRRTTFTLRLPLTLSVIRAALAEISGEPYAFPLSRLKRIVRFAADECSAVQGRQQFQMDGYSVGLLQSAELLGLPATPTSDEELSVVVLGDGDQLIGLVVDRFIGEQDLVVRPLDPRLGRVPHISSAAVMESGEPLLIVDIDDLLRSMQQRLADGRLRGMRSVKAADTKRRRRVLVVDDSLTVREVERQLLQTHGYEVDVAVDGRDGWNAISTGTYDMLITDVDMPRMNGIELIRAVRGDERLAELPVIVVSYKDREQDRLLGMEVGANAYLTKGSFHDDSFITVVADLIGDRD